MFKEKSCKKAHQRTHESNGSNRDCKDHAERMTAAEIYHAVCAGKSKQVTKHNDSDVEIFDFTGAKTIGKELDNQR